MISEKNGQQINRYAHIEQSINTILRTRIGSRIMRESFGSYVVNIIDQPVNKTTFLYLTAAIYTALLIWEPRITIDDVNIRIPDTNQPEHIQATIGYTVIEDGGSSSLSMELLK